MRRRRFLELVATNLGGVLIYSLDGHLSRVSAQNSSVHSVQIPLRFFSRSEALVVAAATSRIFPSDESGPGAKEAGVVIYIDRQLAGPWGRDRYRYTQGPFNEDVPHEFGYQGEASPRKIYRDGLKKLRGFDRLDPREQDSFLRGLESTRFFELLLRNTVEGMFCDPLHGGNVDMIGWQLIGFPGPRMSNAADVDKHYGSAFRPTPISLSMVTEGKLVLSEDEEKDKDKL